MLDHYNCIVVECFKEIFQGVDTNNLPTVLQALKELNFNLANRTPELSAHYGFPLEPHQISAEKVPDFVSTYLSRPATNPLKHNSRGRPGTRGNHQYRPSKQSWPVPRHNYDDRTGYTHRSDTYPHYNRLCHDKRSYYQSRYGDRDRCHSHLSPNTNTSITRLTISTIITAMFNIMHLICLH